MSAADLSHIEVPPGLPPDTSGDPTARRYQGRVAVVTGAARGIGRATVLRLVAEGAKVVAADLDLAGVRETASLAPRGRVTALRVDVRSVKSVDAFAARVAAKHPQIDLLVNNAGIEILGSIEEVDPDAWDLVMDVNLRGTYLVSRALLPLIRARAAETGRAAVVHNASLMGLVSSRRLAAYCATKAGVVSLTRSMALDLAETGIRVNCVCPGIIHTPMLEARFALEPDRAAAYRRTTQRPPVHHIGRPQDVAAAIAYLGSDEARFVTGVPLTIDGGVGAE
ncbi:MAG: SDR family oxidoreductase [Chloroflexota bacterium]